MIVLVTNPGSNLSDAIVARYGIAISPQTMSVDGVLHDTRASVPLTRVEAWVGGAAKHPHVLGASAIDFVVLFREAVQRGATDVIAVMNSRHLAGAHTAATVAARTCAARFGGTRFHVVDTGFIGGSVGLCTLVAARAAEAGCSAEEVLSLLRAFTSEACSATVPLGLDYMRRAGTASMPGALSADAVGMSPVIAIRGGETQMVERCRRDDASVIGALVRYATENIRPGRPVSLTLSHGQSPSRAEALLARMKQALDVRHAIVRPFHASVYNATGPGALAFFAAPIDGIANLSLGELAA